MRLTLVQALKGRTILAQDKGLGQGPKREGKALKGRTNYETRWHALSGLAGACTPGMIGTEEWDR